MVTEQPLVEADERPVAVDRRARLLLAAAALAYTALFLRWSFRNFDGLGTFAFDVGIFDQGVWLLSRLEEPFVTINGRNLFGDHTSFILLPLAAVYCVLPTAKVLLTAQTVALAAAAWPTFLIARKKLGDEWLAALVGVAYLVHPVVGWTNLNEGFHPDAFEIPLVLAAFWFVLGRRWTAYWICIAGLLLVKEDVGLLTFGLGIYVALRHDRRVGLITCGVSLAYLVAAFAVVIPAMLGSGTVYTGRIPFGGPTGFLGRAVTHPGDVASHLLTQAKGFYIVQLVAPLGFAPWWAPGVAVVALGPLALNLISDFDYQYDVRYHYSTLILPILVVATVYGVASGPAAKHAIAVRGVLAASMLCAYLWSPLPFGDSRPAIADPSRPAVAAFHRARQLLPPDAVVAAHYSYVPHLSHRRQIYMFPNPFQASYWGTFETEGQRLPQADRVQYVVMPNPAEGLDGSVLAAIRDEFTLVYDEAGVQLFERRPPASAPASEGVQPNTLDGRRR